MTATKEKVKSRPKARPKPPSPTGRATWMERERGLAPFLCRCWPKSETGFKF